MRKRILILGASRYYSRCIVTAQEMGHEVLLFDRDPDAYGFRLTDLHEPVDISDPAACVAEACRHGVDGVVALNDFGVPSAAEIANALGLPGISPEAAMNATSKARMRRIWEVAGVPSARFRVVESVAQAHVAASELASWPLIVKPADSRGGGSRGVSRVDGPSELDAAVAFAQQFYTDRSVVIEEYLEGLEHSAETLTHAGETHVIAVSDKVKTPPPYRVDKSVVYPTVVTGAALERIREVCVAAVRALGIDTGAAHVELCSTAGGPRLFEVGARCGGGGTADPIVPYVSGVQLFQEVIRNALGETPHTLTPTLSRGCVYHFLTPSPGVVEEVTGLDRVAASPGILDSEVLVSPGDTIRPVRVGGDRAGFVIAGGETREAAIERAHAAERAIRFVVAGGTG